MGLSTHILDIGLGKPAAGVSLLLSRQDNHGWNEVGRGTTDADGRCRTLLGDMALEQATYRLRFEVGPYFKAQRVNALYPFIEIVFDVAEPTEHYHIPLLLAANSYTTYRGS